MAPKKPTGKSSKIGNGSVGRICPQSEGAWEEIVGQFVEDYLFHEKFNYTKVSSTLPKKPPPGTDPRETEDCLFLDVHAPTSVFNSGKASAPVLVWVCLLHHGYTKRGVELTDARSTEADTPRVTRARTGSTTPLGS